MNVLFDELRGRWAIQSPRKLDLITRVIAAILLFSSSSFSTIPTVRAEPVYIQAEDGNLLDLLLQYNQTISELGAEHPTALKLRSTLDAKLKGGERVAHEDAATRLAQMKLNYGAARTAFGESHPSVTKILSDIVMLTELLNNKPEYLAEHVDDIIKAKEDWVSGVLYVPNQRFVWVVRDVSPDAAEVEIPHGAIDGLKLGMHLHLYALQGRSRYAPNLIDGESCILGQVTKVETSRASVRLLSSIPGTESTSILFTQPSFRSSTHIVVVKFGTEAWKSRPLMNAFLGDLISSLSTNDSALPKILVTDWQHESSIDLLPLGPAGYTLAQLQLVRKLDDFVKNQPYFSNFKSIPVADLEKMIPKAGKVPPIPKPDEQQKSKAPTESDTSQGSSTLLRALREWQDGELQGTTTEPVPDLLTKLRTKADEAEKASISKAIEVRNAIAAKPAPSSEEIEKLRTELRTSVDESFNARNRLQMTEFTSLSIQLQKMLEGLNDRAKNQKDIVDRRIDDLLNPNYRWENFFAPQQSITKQPKDSENSVSSSVFEQTRRRKGWQIDQIDGILEFVIQIPPLADPEGKKAAENILQESKAVVPTELKGRYGRIVIRGGTELLPREPSLIELERSPILSLHFAEGENQDRLGWQLDKDNQLQIIVSIHKNILQVLQATNNTFPKGQELVTHIPTAVGERASSVLVQITELQVKPARSPNLADVEKLPRIRSSSSKSINAPSVRGEVIFRGKPISGSLTFHSASNAITVPLDEAGKFQFDSSQPGNYRVTFESKSRFASQEIASKYKNAETTPIALSVPEGPSEFTIELSDR